MAKNKNRRREINPIVSEKIPLVSVIIPMYNSAKFIRQTLESLLYQTMKDFEVVVIDDCSTDNSVEVVESFKPRFDSGGGIRLHVIKLPKNTGTPGLPRNVGIQFARGKYIAFLDSDDLYTKTALEELSGLAEEYQADVVHSDQIFNLWGGLAKPSDAPEMTDMNALTDPRNFRIWKPLPVPPLKEPVLESKDIGERVSKWLTLLPNAFWATCFMFCKRDYIIADRVFFSDMCNSEDIPFTFKAFCTAKNWLNVSNITYIVRPRDDSITRVRTPEKRFIKEIRTLEAGFKEFKRILENVNFFAERPDYRHAVLDWFIRYEVSLVRTFYEHNPPFALNELINREWQDSPLATHLFGMVNVYLLQNARLQRELEIMKHS